METIKFAIRCDKNNVNVERFGQNGAIGWRIHRPCGSPDIVHFDEHYAAFDVFRDCAAFDVFRVGYGRDPSLADWWIMEAIKKQL